MTIYEIIESIAAIGSTNAKKAILEANKGNEILKLCFQYAYNPRYNYWIKAKVLPCIEGKNDIGSLTFCVLDTLITRQVTGDAARRQVEKFMETLTAEAQEIMVRIINHDLRCGASDTLASKIWPNLVPEYPVLLCSKFNEKSQKYLKQFEGNVGYWAELKSDGGRLISEVDIDGTVRCRSRNGNVLNLYGVFDAQLCGHTGMIFDGELIVPQKDGKPNRQQSNGLYTKAVRGTLSEEEAAQFHYTIWDCIPREEYSTGGSISYDTRRHLVENFNFSKNVSQVYGEKVQTLEQCLEFYGRMRADGQEGAVIKVASAVWEDARSKNYVKIKAENTGDFLCVGVEMGQGKYANMIGNLICETSDGKVRFDVGTGLKDADRDPSIDYTGSIIEVKYNEIISAKGRTTKSLFLPVYVQRRLDKSVANTEEELT